MLLEGIFAAATTPFYSDERVYYRKLEANVARYSRSLLSGLAVLGSTGEAVALDDTEAKEVLRVAAEAATPEKVLLAGVGRESVKSTLELAEAAATFRYDAILVRPPSYYSGQLTPAALRHYFLSIADRSPLPVVLYNNPKCVPVQIPVDVIADLAQHPGIIGIKESSGDMERVRAIIAATQRAARRTVTVTTVFEAVTARMLTPASAGAATFVSAGDLAGGLAVATAAPPVALKTRTSEVGFQTLIGSARGVLEGLEAGATGAVLAFAACAPQACHEIYQAWKDHDTKLAHEKHQRILGPSQRIVSSLGIRGVKYACDFNGYFGGRPRSPLLPVTAEEKAEIENLLAEIRN